MDGKKFNVHLDGYNMIPYFSGEAKESPRNAIVYFSDDGDVIAVRVGDYKFNLSVQRANQMQQWAEPFVKLRVPHIVNLRRDPFERGRLQLQYLLGLGRQPRTADVPDAGRDCGSRSRDFEKFPPRQKPASFNLDSVMEQVKQPHG